ncbi:MAG: tRNA-dihydrouridine synthase family protein [Lachnospiraceae bacterium]|nr:tRNA-dihydrouridine synthase family protein [Lachnospiraceae bacterium]
MFYSFAPMEGITAYPFRNAHAAVFPGMDRYYTPFLTANQTRSFKTKEKKDANPANNTAVSLVPQILTNKPDQFLWAVEGMAALGYKEVNLNLGCPSPTVTSHGKGSAFLKDTDLLDRFFDDFFAMFSVSPCSREGVRISIKTRIGFEDPAEAAGLIEVFNRYPFAEVLVHPRVGKELYRGTPHRDVFQMFYEKCTLPLAYNGDIRTPAEARELTEEFPELRHIMIGRGLLTNPALVRELQGGEPLTMEELRTFHNLVLENWMDDIGDFRNVIGRMKELWFYWEKNLENGEKAVKKVRKSRTREEYNAAAAAVFADCSLKC